jgi:hypothetical protein
MILYNFIMFVKKMASNIVGFRKFRVLGRPNVYMPKLTKKGKARLRQLFEPQSNSWCESRDLFLLLLLELEINIVSDLWTLYKIGKWIWC